MKENVKEDFNPADYPDLEGVAVPEGDDKKADRALFEAARIAFGPTHMKYKLDAIKTLLTFTKQKPASKVEAKVESPEDWLKSTLAELDAK
jgi:hypothetical protein